MVAKHANRHRPDNGFTLVEVLMAVGILSLIGLGVSGSLVSVFKAQQNVVGKDEANEFAAALGRHFFTQDTCKSTFATGAIVMPGNGAPPIDLSITNFNGYGARPGYPVQAGFEISPAARVTSLQLRSKGVAPEPVNFGGTPYTRFMAQVVLRLEVKKGDGFSPLPDRFYEFPVYTDPAPSQIIRECVIESQTAEVCSAMGGTYDPATKQCTTPQSCQFKGHYMEVSCSQVVGGICDPAAHSRINPTTGGLSCPDPNQTRQTGENTYTTTVSCGKKCSLTVTRTDRFFICLQCN